MNPTMLATVPPTALPRNEIPRVFKRAAMTP
jgi:hypothetical protein